MRIREVYVRERRLFEQRISGRPSHFRSGPQWDGGRGRSGRTYVAVWPKIARFVLKNRLEPDAFVRRQFQLHSGSFVIKPNQLYNGAALDRYREVAKVSRQEIAASLRSQQNALVRAVRQFQDMAEIEGEIFPLSTIRASVLLDAEAPFTALFRYCMARSEKLNDIARVFRAAAVVQYVRDAAIYNEIWGARIPEKFKRYAEREYDKLLAEASGDDTKGNQHGKGK